MTTDGMTPADIAAVTGNNGGFGFGGDGAWWIIILFLFAFCGGWGNNGFGGNGGSGAYDNYVLTSDFSQLERKLDSITNGLCDGFYTNAQLINGVQQSIATQGYETRNAVNAVQTQLASCCCDIREGISNVNYNMAMNTNALQNSVNQGFCNTNFNMQNAARDITDNANANTKAILDFLVQDKIQTLQSENEALRLQASQAIQNNTIISALKPVPIPAYVVPNNGCGCNYCAYNN